MKFTPGVNLPQVKNHWTIHIPSCS